MAMPRKYLRPIIIDSVSYLWRVHRYENDALPYLQIEVVNEEQSGPSLTTYVDLYTIQRGPAFGPQGVKVEYFSCHVTPAMVRELILYGLAHGWDPIARTKPLSVEPAKASPTLVAAIQPEVSASW